MGKRHLGELSVFDLVIAVTLGAVAGADLADPEVPHGPTVMTILMLGVLHQLISRIVLQHRQIGRYLTFDPMVVIQNGTILHRNLAHARYSVFLASFDAGTRQMYVSPMQLPQPKQRLGH